MRCKGLCDVESRGALEGDDLGQIYKLIEDDQEEMVPDFSAWKRVEYINGYRFRWFGCGENRILHFLRMSRR